MIKGSRMMMRRETTPELGEWFDCGWYGSNGYGGRYFVNTLLTGLVGIETKIETLAYWVGNTSSFGNWNQLFCAQSSDGADDTIQIRRNYFTGYVCANRQDNITIAIPTAPENISLDGEIFTVGDTVKTVSASSVQNISPLVLGGSFGIIYSSHQDRLKRCWHGFIGRTKVYVLGTIISDMIPLADGSGFFDIKRKIVLTRTDIKSI